MEPVKQFNQELSSLYEIKPPISKAKMTAITKGAIRAIKYYKHVVQSVEKFIQKCRPEYKIPGLYVIDSIVRQSRHQFGSEKDVFAPRFAKNIRLTFFNLYKCTEEEKSKVIRVLNLWQKNEVFQSDVIQPLFDLANPNSELSKQMEDQSKRGLLGTGGGGSGGEKPIKTPTISIAPETQTQNRQPSLNQQQPDEQVKSRRGRHGGGQTTPTEMDQQVYQQLQTIQQLLKNHVPTSAEQVKFNKKLLDFDYSDDEEGGVDGPEAGPSAAMLEVLQGILSSERVLQKLKSMGEISDGQIQQLQQLIPQFQALQQPQQQQQQQQMQPPTQQIHQQIQQQPFLRVSPQVASVFPPQHSIGSSPQPSVQPIQGFGQFGPGFQMSDPNQMSGISVWGAPSQPLLLDDPIEDDIQILEDRSNAAATWRREGRSIRSSRSRSGSRERRRGGRSGGRRSSRSRSRSRDRGSRRRRSRSPRDRKESEKDREKKREREKKGLPPLKKNCLGVCSTTLWVGHLSRLVGDEDLSDMFGEFGAIESIDLIPPRGCAFICMNRRQDAYKALKTLNKTKIHGKPITIAWAPGKCMKDEQWKDYWDVELGVSYIPYDKLDPQVNFADLEEGGMFDEDTVPDWLKNLRDNAPMQINSQPFQEQAKQQLPGPPPGFVRIPEGISPAIGATPTPQETIQIPVPGPHPPGMPPFGLPPGLAQAGLLPSPAVLAGAQAILNAQGAPRLIGPPGILLPRFGLAQPPPMGGHPPPGFPPSFDISQPPPGLRPPFPQLGQAPPQISDAGSDDMDIDQDVPTIQPVVTNDRMKNDRDRDRTSRDRGSRDRDRGDRDRLSRDRDRLSRDRDRDRDRGDRERDRGDRDRDRRDRPRESRWSRVEKSPEKVPEGKDNRSSRDDSLLSRLRNIAGHVESEGQKSKQDQRDGRDSGPPHPREHGDRGPPPFDRRDGPPPFGTPGGPPPRFGGPQGRFPGPNQIRGDKPGGDQGPGPRFNGPPGPGGFRNEGPGGFRNGPPPPHFHNGGQPPFRDGQGGPPPPFGGSNEAGSPFGGDFNMRGGRGNFWRGRGGRGGPMGPMGGPGGRGGFRGGFDGPPNMMGGDNFDGFPNDRDGGWPDGGGPPGRGRGRGGWRGGPPHNEHFDRSGGPEPFDRNNRPGDFNRDRDRRSRENDRSFGSKDDDDRRSRDRDREDSKERSENRREKRSRWGGGDNANSESPDHSKSNNKPGLLGDWKSPDSNLEKQNDDPPHKEKETVVASAQIEVAPSHDSEKEVGHFDPESATESKAQPEPNSRISDSEQNSRNPNEIESDTRISDSEQNARIPIESDSNTPQAFEQEKQADIFRPQEQSFSESLYDSESQQDFDSRSNDIEMRPESSLDADSQPGIGFRNVNQPETEDESARHGTDEAQFQPTAAEPQEFFPTTEPDFSNDAGNDASQASFRNDVGNDMGNDASQASFRNDVGNDMGNDASQTSFRNDVGNDMGNDASQASFRSEGDSHTGYNNEESRERSDNTEPPSFEAHVPDFSASNDDFSVDNFEAEPEAGVALAASTSESEPPVNHDVAEQESAE